MTEDQKKYFVDGDSTKTIKEQLDSISTITEEVAKQASEEIAAKMKERQVNEVKMMILQSNYFTEITLMKLHKSRDISKIAKDQMTKVGKLNDEVLAGNKPLNAFNKEIEAINAEFLKAKREIDSKYSEIEQQILDRYPDSWLYRNNLRGL